MTYVVPQTLVFQEVNDVVQAVQRQLPAHISGGNAYLLRYAQAAEKPLGALGAYNADAGVCYDWPSLPAGAIVDPTYTQLYIDNALLQYFNADIGTGDHILSVAGYNNRVRSSVVAFAANGTAYPASAVMGDRGAKVGDIAKVRAVVGANTYILWTYISGFVGEVVPAVTGVATSDANNNPGAGSTTTSVLHTGGPRNCVDPAANASAYKGLPSGHLSEVYTITVTQSSVGHNLATAQLRVTSASGQDNQAAVTPSAAGVPTPIGTRGLTVTFNFDNTAACSLSAHNEDVPPEDLVAGQVWQVSVQQAFTPPVPTSGGVYTGASNCTYIATVTKGGLWSAGPQLTITTDNGSDSSGPVTVTAPATAVALGTHGVTLSFTGTGLCYGDKYDVTVTAQAAGAYQTLVLGNNLNSLIPAGTEVGVTLYIKENIQLPANRIDTPPLTNWTQNATQICLQAGATYHEPTWTVGGVVQPLPVVSDTGYPTGSQMYVQYRAWYQTLVGQVATADVISNLDNIIPGPLSPDNPLKWAAYYALQNSNGVPCKVTAVSDPSVAANWNAVLEAIDGRTDVYGLVPLTYDATTIGMFVAHVNGQSTPNYNNYRVLWVNLPDVGTSPIVTSATSKDGNLVLAVMEDAAGASGAPYNQLRVPAGNGNFLANGVLPGDTVHYQFTTDGFGNTVYNTYQVASVLNEDTLELVAGGASPIGTPQKLEVWRTLSADQDSAAIAAKAGNYANRRVRAVWPDTVGSGGTTFPGYHLCAALAGLVSGVVPHQGLTNLQLQGFDDLTRTYKKFNRTQLNAMAAEGTWIVTQDPVSGVVFTRHAVTTATPDGNINDQEEMIVRNLDSISFLAFDQFSPYIGIANVTPSMVAVLTAECESLLSMLKGNLFIQRLGPQLIDGSIIEVRRHTTLKDRMVVSLNLTLPYALNNLEVYLVI